MTIHPFQVAQAHDSGRSFDDLNSVILRAFRRFSDSILLQSATGETYTGSQLEAEVARYVAALTELGVGPGNRVALLAANSVEVLFVQNAVGFLGAAFVPLHPMGSPSDFANILQDADVETVVVSEQRRSEIQQAVEISASSARVLTLGGAAGR